MGTRFYLYSDTPAPVEVAIDAEWVDVPLVVSGRMSPVLSDADVLADGLLTHTTVASGVYTFHRQFVSDPLVGGQALHAQDYLNNYFKLQIQGRESDRNDKLDGRVRNLRVVSRDGLVVRAALISLGTQVGAEWSTQMRNLTFLNLFGGLFEYTTQPGDRLVLEVGHGGQARGKTQAAVLRFGAPLVAAGDLGENETYTGLGLRPWLELYADLVFEAS